MSPVPFYMATGTIKLTVPAKYTAGSNLSRLWAYAIGLYVDNGKTISIMLIMPGPIIATNFSLTACGLYLKNPDGTWVLGRQFDATQMVTEVVTYTNYMTIRIDSDTVISSAGYCYGQTIISGTFA